MQSKCGARRETSAEASEVRTHKKLGPLLWAGKDVGCRAYPTFRKLVCPRRKFPSSPLVVCILILCSRGLALALQPKQLASLAFTHAKNHLEVLVLAERRSLPHHAVIFSTEKLSTGLQRSKSFMVPHESQNTADEAMVSSCPCNF